MQMATENAKRIAIACQGGGSHTAFTAGVLRKLLQSHELSKYEIVGLSGTSGGAVCALLAWYALLDRDPARAGRLLDEFWRDNSANSPLEQFVNAWVIWASTLSHFVVTPAVSPYDTLVSVTALNDFRAMLQRRVDFDALDVQADGSHPILVVGAVDVLSGDFKAFTSRHDKISADMIMASAAIPTLFRSVPVDGGTYWDGLFSQNPPVKELVDLRPDEIWVIQINPKTRSNEPKNVVDIADRRNELSGNLSLHQELHFVEKIDQLLDEGLLASDGRYKNIVVRVIELSWSLGTVSKLNRDPSFIQNLMSQGAERAEQFLAALAFEDAWRRKDVDALMGFFAEDATLVSSAPFPSAGGACRGRNEIRAFVDEHVMGHVVVDLTRKQVAKDHVAWTVRSPRTARGVQARGVARAEFGEGGEVAALYLTG
jgi:NTE family protein